ncbi:MAG: TetR/AcrR family transcriptional regulator [Proteiniphilum sp.]|jgi:AcrR family transcriptional regulator|nr:TetR/AcrR family transcriptional regulator [Proteiniphilum sp.]
METIYKPTGWCYYFHTMANNRKKKQPDIVKGQLLEAAAFITVERGLGSLTLDLVAQRAGVSKGGLIHHFPNKRVLIEKLFDYLLAIFESSIDDYMAEDSNPRGRFSRAYVMASAFPKNEPSESKLHGAFALAMSNNEPLAEIWRKWLLSQMEKHSEDTGATVGQMVRYAADGLWLEACTGTQIDDAKVRSSVIEHLLELTYSI